MHPGATKKKLPWLDGRSSIASTPMVSPPGHVSTPHREGSLSPTSVQHNSASIDVALDLKYERSGAIEIIGAPETLHSPIARSVSTPDGPSEPRKRLSIVHFGESDADMHIRSRADSLAPVPDHLERFDTPESLIQSVQRNVYASPPRIIQTVQRSPSQPVPRPSVFERHSHRKLSNAIEGLEELVDDAVITAETSEQPEYLEKIYEIIEDASTAVHDASAKPVRDLMRTTSPLRASSGAMSRFSSDLHRQPEIQMQHIVEHVPPSPLRTAGQRKPEAIDWAYCKAEGLNDHVSRSLSSSPSSSTSSGPRGRRRARFSSSSDRLQLLPPEPIAATSRDQINHVLRPRVSPSRSRGRSRERRGNAGHYRRHRRHRRSWRSTETGSPPSHKHHRHYGTSNSGTSLDEGDFHGIRKPMRSRGYGEELHVRDARHHTFSLHRNHRRQPVARNWRTGKKRICALIACANTAVLGIIIGIYVSTDGLCHHLLCLSD